MDLNIKQAFANVWTAIARPENYVPRDYHTVGGMWTVDTWKGKIGDVEVTAQLMDEGASKALVTPKAKFFCGYTGNISVWTMLGTKEQGELSLIELAENIS